MKERLSRLRDRAHVRSFARARINGNRYPLLGPQDILFCLLAQSLASFSRSFRFLKGLRLRLGRASLCIGDSFTVALSELYANEHFQALSCRALEVRLRTVGWGTPSTSKCDVFTKLENQNLSNKK
ncbi:hypothetical protein Tco_1372159 [Tanacetum coccineum]